MTPKEFLDFCEKRGYEVTRYKKWSWWPLHRETVGGTVHIGCLIIIIKEDIVFGKAGYPNILDYPDIDYPDSFVEDPMMDKHQAGIKEARKRLKLR